jgi:hypothetical protein
MRKATKNFVIDIPDKLSKQIEEFHESQKLYYIEIHACYSFITDEFYQYFFLRCFGSLDSFGSVYVNDLINMANQMKNYPGLINLKNGALNDDDV